MKNTPITMQALTAVGLAEKILNVQAKGGITPDIVEALSENNKTLQKLRRKRQIPETLATPEEVSRLDLAGSFPIHKTTQASRIASPLLTK